MDIREIQQQSASIALPLQVLAAARRVATLYCNKFRFLMRILMLPRKSNEGRFSPSSRRYMSESSPEFSESACGSGQDRQMKCKDGGGGFGQLENELLAYVWPFDAVLIPPRYLLWDQCGWGEGRTTGDVFEKQHSTGQPQWKYIGNIL